MCVILLILLVLLQGETLKIVMAPQRTRTTIGFEQRPSQGGLDGSLPRLTLFEHVTGARVLADLFPYYRLPNGKKAYYYYDAGESSLPWTSPLIACDRGLRACSVGSGLSYLAVMQCKVITTTGFKRQSAC